MNTAISLVVLMVGEEWKDLMNMLNFGMFPNLLNTYVLSFLEANLMSNCFTLV